MHKCIKFHDCHFSNLQNNSNLYNQKSKSMNYNELQQLQENCNRDVKGKVSINVAQSLGNKINLK